VATLVFALGKALALALVIVLIVVLGPRGLSPLFAPPLLSRSLPFCAIAGMASRERTSTANERYFSFFTEVLLISVSPVSHTQTHGVLVCSGQSHCPKCKRLFMNRLCRLAGGRAA